MLKHKIINCYIDNISYRNALDKVVSLSISKRGYVCLVNVHMLIESYDDTHFCNIVNQSDLSLPDGMPVAKSFSLLYDIDQKRIAGMNFIQDIFFECRQHQLKIFIYGSTDDVLLKTSDKLRKDFPGLEVSFFSPPFRPLTTQEKHDVIDMVNSASPDLIVVALGCPKQEKWMYEHRDLISGCMVGLGGALSVYAGEISRAPLWMQQAGLEWLYRLSKEPRRLFSRYAYTNSKFLMLLFVQFLRVKFRGVK